MNLACNKSNNSMYINYKANKFLWKRKRKVKRQIETLRVFHSYLPIHRAPITNTYPLQNTANTWIML